MLVQHSPLSIEEETWIGVVLKNWILYCWPRRTPPPPPPPQLFIVCVHRRVSPYHYLFSLEILHSFNEVVNSGHGQAYWKPAFNQWLRPANMFLSNTYLKCGLPYWNITPQIDFVFKHAKCELLRRRVHSVLLFSIVSQICYFILLG